jgi:hypothetical protein
MVSGRKNSDQAYFDYHHVLSVDRNEQNGLAESFCASFQARVQDLYRMFISLKDRKRFVHGGQTVTVCGMFIREWANEGEDAIKSEEISETVIDEYDWEDSVSENGRSSPLDEQLFQRVDSRPNLQSRRSNSALRNV